MEGSRIFRAHGSSLEVLQFLSASVSPLGKYISYIFLLLLILCFTYFVPYSETFIQKSELWYSTTDFTETTYQTSYQPKTRLLTVYQLSEVRYCLSLWVSTVFNKKVLIFIDSFSVTR